VAGALASILTVIRIGLAKDIHPEKWPDNSAIFSEAEAQCRFGNDRGTARRVVSKAD
jgi:DNA-binding GntR family transcriptional regulator